MKSLLSRLKSLKDGLLVRIHSFEGLEVEILLLLHDV